MIDLSYKETKSLDELITHLKENKNIKFNVIDEEEAKEILYTNNYINVVTPFKHRFCDKHKVGGKFSYKNSDGVHTYSKETEFYNIVKLYIEERSMYPTIRNNIDTFESKFKSVISHELLVYLKKNDEEIDTQKKLRIFISQCKLIASLGEGLDVLYTSKNLEYWGEELSTMMEKKRDIFVFFDHLTLGNWMILLSGLKQDLSDHLFKVLNDCGLALETSNMYDFIVRFKILREIRNCVAHRNSLEILFRYRNVKTNELRYISELRKYERVKEILEKEDKFLDIYSLRCDNKNVKSPRGQ